MKKTILALVLVVALIVCFGAFTASAEETAHEHCVCAGTVSGNDAHTCESVTWTPISEALAEVGLTAKTANFGKLPSGNYYLDTDLVVTAVSTIGSATIVKDDAGTNIDRTYTTKTLAIDLNGHKVTSTASRVFGSVYYGSKLTITDCVGTGTIEGASTTKTTTGSILYTYAGSTLDIYGGNFVAPADTSANSYGLFCIACDVYKEADGKAGLSSTDQTHADNRCFLNVYGGTFTGGAAKNDGGVIVFWHNAQANIYGGTFTGSNVGRNGGVFTISGAGSNVKIMGGTISGGTAAGCGDQIYISGGTLTLDAQLETLALGLKDVSITLGANFSAEKVTVESASTKKLTTIVSKYDNAAQLACFEAKNEADTLYANKKVDSKNQAVLVQGDVNDGKHYACNCGGAYASYYKDVGHTSCTIDTTWQDLGAFLAEQNVAAGTIYAIPAGRYYLSGDLTVDHYFAVANATVYIDLNGYTLTGGAQPTSDIPLLRMKDKGKLYVTDSSYDPTAATVEEAFKGTIAVSGSMNYPLMYVNGTKTGSEYNNIVRVFGGKLIFTGTQHKSGIICTSGEFRLFNGYINGGKSTTSGSSICVYDSGKLMLWGGHVEGGEAASNGGNILINKTGSIGIYDAIVSGGKANKGGNIYMGKGTLNMYAGQVIDGYATTSGGNIYIHGGYETTTNATTGVKSFTRNEATFNMRGGIISGGVAGKQDADGKFTSGTGGNVAVYGQYATTSYTIDGVTTTIGDAFLGKFNMTAGTITSGKSRNAGNVDNYGTMVMSGGTITEGFSEYEGGNLRVYYVKNYDTEGNEITASSFTMNGGEITKGQAGTSGGNILTYGNTYLNTGKLTDGQSASMGGNLRPFRPAKVTIGKDFVISGGNASVGGNIAAAGMFSDDAGAWPAYCYMTVQGTVIDGTSETNAANIYLSDYAVTTIDGATVTGGVDTDVYLNGDSQLTIKGTPVIGKLHLTNATNQQVDVSELNVTTPISLVCDKAGAFASSETDKSASFTNDMGREITFKDGKLYIGNANIVYVSNSGKDTNDGSENAPFKTINHAIDMVQDYGTVHIVGVADVSSLSKHDKHVTLTGGELVMPKERVELKDHFSFKNMILTLPHNTEAQDYYFYCNGFTTLIDSDVTVRYFDGTNYLNGVQNSALYGGCRTSYQTTYGNIQGTNLTVLSGTWGHIYGGNNACVLNGDAHLTVGGYVNKDLDYATTGHSSSTNGYNLVYGGSRNADLNGNAYLTVTGGKFNSIYGGSRGAYAVNNIELRIQGGEAMAAYGAGIGGAQTVNTINFYFEGGYCEQVFGGTLSQALTGDVNMYITGGEISRRLYGGCYNGTSGLSWSTNNAVTGNIRVYIDDGANITCTLDKNDRGIYGHSRRGNASTSDAENAEIIFMTRAAYEANEDKLGMVDRGMLLFSAGKPIADLICYLDWNANEETNVISSNATAVEDPETGKTGNASAYVETVTLTLADGPFYYNAKAHEPATVTENNWKQAAYELAYADNTEIGTATVTLTANGYTVSETFEIIKKDDVAQVGDTKYEYLCDAVNAVAEGGYMQILIDCDEAITISKTMYLDLNGNSLTGKVTVAEGATLYGADSTTDDYDCSDGYGEITNVEGDVAFAYVNRNLNGKNRRYVTYTDPTTGAMSFHRIYLGVTSVSLRPGSSGMGYKATIAGDQKVTELMTDKAVSMTMWIEGSDKQITKSIDMANNRMIVSALVRGINVDEHSETNLMANVSVTLRNGDQIVTIISASTTSNLKQTIMAVAKAYATGTKYNDAQMSALHNLCNAHRETLSQWGGYIDSILNWTPSV